MKSFRPIILIFRFMNWIGNTGNVLLDRFSKRRTFLAVDECQLYYVGRDVALHPLRLPIFS